MNKNTIEQLLQKYCPDGVEFKDLGDVAQLLNGYAFQSGKYCEKGIRVIRISDVQKSKMSNKDLKYYPIETINEIKRYLLQENDLVMSLTGNVGRVAMLSKTDLPAVLNQRVACIRANEEKILTRFLFHFFDQDSFESEAMANATGGGQKNMSTTWLGKFQIPIPPIEIQKEIVKILDTFTELEAELEAELEDRKKQYEYYRDDLLSFGDDEVEWKTLDEVCLSITAGGDLPEKFSKGQTTPTEEFPYPIFANAVDLNGLYGYTDNYKIESEAVTISARGAKVGFHTIRKPKFTPIIRLISLVPNKEIILNKYLNYILDLTSISGTEGGIPQLTVPTVKKIKIQVPYKNGEPDLVKQQEIVAILDKFDALVNDISVGLPAELKARRQQYEYYRNILLTFKPLEK